MPLVVAGKIDAVPLVASLQAEIDKQDRLKGAVIASPAYDANGVLRLEGVVSRDDQTAAVEEFVRGKLKGSDALPQGGQVALACRPSTARR